MAETTPPTERTTVKRLPDRGRYDADTVNAILDEALYCHVGLVDPAGHPVVLPTIHVRRGDQLYLHGSPANHLLRTAKKDVDVCVTVTLLDGLVYARSVFSHSANYRSAVVHGNARPVTDPAEKLAALRAIVEHTTPGSWEHARQPTTKELAATGVLALDLGEASLKVRTGPPGDEDADVATGAAWAGVLPVRTTFGEPAPCPLLPAGAATPSHVSERAGA
jgi:hypothetical protein